MKTAAASFLRCLLPAALFLVVEPMASAQDGAPLITATPITKVPFIIKKPGTYLVKSDLQYTATTGAAITITTGGVNLDLGGHTTSGVFSFGDANTSIGISGGGGYSSFRHGTLIGFRQGVLNDPTHSETTFGHFVLQDLSAIGCGEGGIDVTASFVEVLHCYIGGTGGVSASAATALYGLRVHAEIYRVENNTIADIGTVAGQFPFGMDLTAIRQGSVIDHNTVTDYFNSTGGFGVTVNSSPAFVTENTVSFFDFGFSLPAGSKYRANLTSGCNTPFAGSGTAVGSENN